MLKKFILNRNYLIKLSFLLLISSNLFANEQVKNIVEAYPDFIKGYINNYIIWVDGEKMLFDDNIKNKTYDEKLNYPSLKEQLSIEYLKITEKRNHIPNLYEDAGRIRYEPFFKKMYGSNEKEIKANLVKIKWLPKSSNKVLWVTRINDIDKKLIAISQEIEKLPKNIKAYALHPHGTYNYRKIAKTNRLSMHSFGIAIDLDTRYSNYWLWDKKFRYKNKIPSEIVEIFEKYGFIWGGRWYHYDTMHFEYRPELLK